ncbi:MAG TPA: hypothetical protein VF794_02290 [Archangium sp.]|jgi:hypothetical protein|uniref:hypothetical protein n=1 Tax=Archangium sp. TaxID=1872627 RepID=UPI002ED9508B
MKTHRLMLLAALLAATSGCYRIRYINNVPAESTPALERWHHNAIAGLWEISDPVNVTEACPQGFAEVMNEVTFLNWLAGTAVQAAVSVPIQLATSGVDPATGLATPGYVLPVQLWSPQSVSVTCARVQAPRAAPEAAPQQ